MRRRNFILGAAASVAAPKLNMIKSLNLQKLGLMYGGQVVVLNANVRPPATVWAITTPPNYALLVYSITWTQTPGLGAAGQRNGFVVTSSMGEICRAIATNTGVASTASAYSVGPSLINVTGVTSTIHIPCQPFIVPPACAITQLMINDLATDVTTPAIITGIAFPVE